MKNDDKLNEPEATYKKTITAFNSFDEMEEAQLKYFASLSPEELLRNNKKMSLAAYGLNSKSKATQPDRKIKFKKE